MYAWVAPAESRRKNAARTNPDDPGSILHPGVPLEVMRTDYGCGDIGWLLESSDQPGSVRIDAHGRVFHLPIARFRPESGRDGRESGLDPERISRHVGPGRSSVGFAGVR